MTWPTVWWQWTILALELGGSVFLWDWIRREMKYGRRMAEWRTRVKRRSEDLASGWPAHQRSDYLAALVCARDNGDLLATRDQATAEILRFPRSR